MTDLWSFLLQTLTASGVAALLLAVKALFRDKLSPRWQFGVWGVLALVLLLPAGGGGRYALFNWPLWVESAKTALTGDYSLTRVLAPIPLPLGLGHPPSPADLLYLLYLAARRRCCCGTPSPICGFGWLSARAPRPTEPRSAGWRPHTAAGPAGPWRSPASPRPLSAGCSVPCWPSRRSARWTTR